MTIEERLQSIKESPKTKCTFGDEEDREGYTYQLKDDDLGWLFQQIMGHIKINESLERIIEDMENDYNQLKIDKEYYEALFVAEHHKNKSLVAKFSDENKKYREALNTIRWTSFATNPQAMIMKDIAKNALDNK